MKVPDVYRLGSRGEVESARRGGSPAEAKCDLIDQGLLLDDVRRIGRHELRKSVLYEPPRVSRRRV